MNSDDSKQTILSPQYSGGCDNSSLSNDNLLRMTGPERSLINGPTIFALKYRILPCITRESHSTLLGNCDDIYSVTGTGQMFAHNRARRWRGKQKPGGMFHATSVKQFLIDEYQADPDTFLYDVNYNVDENQSLESTIYIDLGNYLSVLFSGGLFSPLSTNNPNNLTPDHDDNSFICYNHMQIFHVPQTAVRARDLLHKLSKFKIYPVTEATLQMVCHSNQRGFYTSMIRMKKPHIADLKLHYGDEFPQIHEKLLEVLQEKDSTGITFLHGPPGTGKTFYLRYLINEVKDKRLIYVPPDLVNDITKPGFLPFLMQHPNSILIVEDAENIIRDRNKDHLFPNQAVANLLNLSDGLLGDAMHQQIICTFNCDVSGIDPALLREGRLVIEHKFDKLSIANARRLCVELNIPGNGEDIHESTSLAEVYARKNATVAGNSENGVDSVTNTQINRRVFQKKKTQPDNLLGLYS